MLLAGRFKRLVTVHDCCVYCGAQATRIDHFVPVSVVAMLLSVGLKVSGKFLVPACGECNRIASNKIFNTIGAKRRYIQERLRWRYRKLLAMPNWLEADIEQLGYALQTMVRSSMAHKAYVEARIGWRNQFNSESAKLAGIRFRASAYGLGTARQRARKRLTETADEMNLSNSSDL